MKVANEGLVIGKNDGTSSIRISDQRVSMYSGNTEVMYISRGVLHIDNGVFTKTLQVGRFVMSQHEAKRRHERRPIRRIIKKGVNK